MDIFGIRINRIRKDDKRDLEVFNFTVCRLNDHIRRMINILSTNLDLDNLDLSHFLLDSVEILDQLFDMYMSNKFSSPGNAFNIHKQMNMIRSNTLKFNTSLLKYQELKAKALFMSEHDESFFDRDEFEKEVNELMKAFQHHVTILICALRGLLHVIIHDTIRIEMGVDIIRHHYDQQRQIKRAKKNCDQAYVIRISRPNKKNKGAMEK